MEAIDVDAECTARWEALAADIIEQREEEERTHRCPPDMPPCPDCQAIIEAEDEREHGLY